MKPWRVPRCIFVVMAGLVPAIHGSFQIGIRTWMPGTRPRVSGTVCAFMLPSRSLHKHDLPAAAEPLGWRTARSQRCSVVGPVLAVKTLRAAQRLVVDA